MTALIWAAENGKADTVAVLLEAGASIEAKDNVSKRISICTYVCVCVLYILPSWCMISKKYRYTLFLLYILLL